MSQYCSGKVYFQQGTGSSNDGITYHDVKSLANHLGETVCKITPAFHALTGCDFTAPFFGRSRYRIFKNMQKHSNVERLLLSLNIERVEIPYVIDFVIHIVYNRPKSEKTAVRSRYSRVPNNRPPPRLLIFRLFSTQDIFIPILLLLIFSHFCSHFSV